MLRSIYVMRCGDKLKIGIAKDPEKRRKTLQTGNAEKIILEWSRERADAFHLETHLHQKFSNHRLAGEWFDGNSITVNQIQVAAMSYLDHDW